MLVINAKGVEIRKGCIHIMKKLMALFVCCTMLIPGIVVLAADVDLSALSYEELSELKQAVEGEMGNRPEAEIAIGVFTENAYAKALHEISDLMLEGGVLAETQINYIKKVWYNAVYKELDQETNTHTINSTYYEEGKYYYPDEAFRDFNAALSSLFSSADFILTNLEIDINKAAVSNRYKELITPPSTMQRQYDAMDTLFTTYTRLINLALDPKGSLQTFSSDTNSLITEFLEQREKLTLLLPDVE